MSDVEEPANPRREALRGRIQEALERHVRPELEADGVDVELVGIDEDDIVQVRLLGACQGCSSITYAMTMAVEAALKSRVPEVRFIEAVP